MQTNIGLLEGFFSDTLIKSGKRISPSEKRPTIRLHRNEAAFEVDQYIKNDILNEVSKLDWKNYPTPYYTEIEALIGKYLGVDKEQIALAAGSANLITTLLNYTAINKNQIVIAQPSFSLYEFHCKTYGIPYETWKLNKDLEYDVSLLPKIKPFSVVLFASPNNPVGNVICLEDLEYMLKTFEQTFIVVDEVYYEFSEVSLCPLIKKYPNLILLRSFSKTFSAAGLRIGYLISQQLNTEHIRKLILPFSLNYLSMLFIQKILSNDDIISQIKLRIEYTKLEKQRVESELKSIDPYEDKYHIHQTHGNFSLIIFKNEAVFYSASKLFSEANIELLDLSKTPMLANSMRMTIGQKVENNAVLEVFKKL
jgi:histidinol-phosphate aminotransferase